MHGVAVTPSSTVAEHRDLVIREKVRANAPGRIEGRCEHHDRAIARRADTRPGLCLTSEGAHDDGEACAHATRAASSAPSRRWQTRHSPRRPPRRRREPEASRVRPLPSVLPGSSRAPHGKPASTRLSTLDVGRGLVPRLRRGPSRPANDRLVGTQPSKRRRTPRWRGSLTQPSMQCTEWPSRRRARSASTAATWFAITFPRMLPAGSRGGASTTTVQSRADATRAPTSASLRRASARMTTATRALTRHGRRRLHRRDATRSAASVHHCSKRIDRMRVAAPSSSWSKRSPPSQPSGSGRRTRTSRRSPRGATSTPHPLGGGEDGSRA